MKGGVGKSTLTVNLAWHFAGYTVGWNKRVLVVDLDPQFNASQYLLGVREYESILKDGKPTIWDVFEQKTRVPRREPAKLGVRDAIRRIHEFEDGARIDLIPARLELALSLKSPVGQKEGPLARSLAAIRQDYDLILIDCAPTESMLTTAAYLCSDWILVPVKPEYLSSIGLPLLVNSMNDFKEQYPKRKLLLAGIVFNATSDYSPEERLSKSTVRRIASSNGWKVFETEVPYSRSFPKGAREGEPLFRTTYRRTQRVYQFSKFAEEFAERIEL